MNGNKSRIFHSLVLAAFFAAGCGREEVDPASLTTNPMDPSYGGAPVVTIEESSIVYVYDNTGEVVDSLLRVTGRVHADLIPEVEVYNVEVSNTGLGIDGTFGPFLTINDALFNVSFQDPVQGTQYCFGARVIVLGSSSRTWDVCANYE